MNKPEYLIIISKKKKYTVTIDSNDLKRVSKYKWWIKQNNYVYTQINRKTIHLHRFILKLDETEKQEVDHINHNPLDNRKSNLRLVTKSQNNINKSNLMAGIRPYKNQWRARIKINSREIHIGIFQTQLEALNARIVKEIELFNKYSKHHVDK